MSTSKELRTAARADLSGRWNEAAMLSFVYLIINWLTGNVPSILITSYWGMALSLIPLLLLPMVWSYNMTFLANMRRSDTDPFDISHLMDGFHDYVRIFSTLLLEVIYVLLWMLLLVVPGLIKAFSYSMTPYILHDHPELKGNAAIERSMKMMKGHKADFFLLYLSFIGWAFLSLLTLGIGFFWLGPYIKAAEVRFYEEVKEEYEAKTAASGESSDGSVKEEYQQTTDHYQK